MSETSDASAPAVRVLIVDDEPSVLHALRRTLRRHGYEIHLAESGAAALEVLDAHDIAVLICDQRMPGMSGAEVLAEAFARQPETYRITLTGYTDLDAARRSINDGHVNQFLTKPWDDTHLVSIVREGANTHEMMRENRRLQELTRAQNRTLKEWNQKLEATVEKRTKLLKRQNRDLEDLRDQLKATLHDTVAVLANLLEAYDPSLGIHAKRVAALARAIAARLEVAEDVAHASEFASYLHDVGLLARLNGSSGDRSARSTASGSGDRTTAAESGWALLSQIRGFEAVADAVRHQDERFDGTGKPENLRAERIPLASRILAVCNLYDASLYDPVRPTEPAYDAARMAVQRESGRALDPVIALALLTHLDESPEDAAQEREVELAPRQLREGMVLSRDLLNVHDRLLLKEGTLVTRDLIKRLQQMREEQMLVAGVFVRSKREAIPDEDAPEDERRSA